MPKDFSRLQPILSNLSPLGDSIFNCKLLGLNFGSCNPFLLELFFDGCDISFASFYKLKLKGTKYINCKLNEVDFVEADLTSSLFDNCNLLGAIFEYTTLEKANLSTSFNFIIDPEQNKIKQAKFSQHTLSGLLTKYNINII